MRKRKDRIKAFGDSVNEIRYLAAQAHASKIKVGGKPKGKLKSHKELPLFKPPPGGQ